MPRAIWSGAISFGLVNVPVKLYSAVSRKGVRFHQLHDETGVRIQQRRIDPSTGEEVAYEHIVKGYEISPDRYVVIDPEELDALAPRKTRTIDIEDFAEPDEIDPLFFDQPYYLVPGQGAAKSYALLRQAMEQTGRIAIARVVLRQKESLVAIRPAGDLLTMTTMRFADELVPPEALEGELPAEGDEPPQRTSKRELDMAAGLIDSLAAPFEPERYHDEYRAQVLDLIERKAAGKEIAVQPSAEPAPATPDLMAALEASIQAAKGASITGDGAPKPKKPRRSPTDGAKKQPGTRAGGKAKKQPGTRAGSGRSRAKKS